MHGNCMAPLLKILARPTSVALFIVRPFFPVDLMATTMTEPSLSLMFPDTVTEVTFRRVAARFVCGSMLSVAA